MRRPASIAPPAQSVQPAIAAPEQTAGIAIEQPTAAASVAPLLTTPDAAAAAGATDVALPAALGSLRNTLADTLIDLSALALFSWAGDGANSTSLPATAPAVTAAAAVSAADTVVTPALPALRVAAALGERIAEPPVQLAAPALGSQDALFSVTLPGSAAGGPSAALRDGRGMRAGGTPGDETPAPGSSGGAPFAAHATLLLLLNLPLLFAGRLLGMSRPPASRAYAPISPPG